MVKLSYFLALSTIAPTFASELWDIEMLVFDCLFSVLLFSDKLLDCSRDVTEPHFFGRELNEAEATVFSRDIEGLFARQQDFEHVDLVRRFDFDWDRITNACKAARKMGFRA